MSVFSKFIAICPSIENSLSIQLKIRSLRWFFLINKVDSLKNSGRRKTFNFPKRNFWTSFLAEVTIQWSTVDLFFLLLFIFFDFLNFERLLPSCCKFSKLNFPLKIGFRLRRTHWAQNERNVRRSHWIF